MDEATKGKWLGVANAPGDLRMLGDDEGVFAVHAILMKTGRVLLFSGRVETSAYLYRSWTWDPTTFAEGDTTLTGVEGRWFLSSFDPGGADEGGVPTWDDDPNIDLFCAHHVVLEDGRVLVVGGAGGEAEGDARGNPAIFTYDPDDESWTKEAHLLQRGRWYPTAVHLGDGRVVVVSGRAQDNGSPEPVAEVVSLPDLQPSVIAGGDRPFWIYPGLLMVPGGQIYFVPTTWMIETQDDTAALDRLTPTLALDLGPTTAGTWQSFDDPASPGTPLSPSNPWREEGTFVLLPPAQAGRILLIGGGYATHALRSWGEQRAEADIGHCEILETQGSSPRWVEAGQLNHGRVNVHAVLLPDGKVLILGGHDSVKRNTSHQDQLIAELYDPSVPYDPADPSAAFTELAAMNASRNYHATALLLPDGRVLTAGGEDGPHGGGNRTSIEIYEPPYCHQGPRSVVDAVEVGGAPDGEIRYGGRFVVRMATAAQAGDIAEVVLMRPGAPTHHTDTEQRHVPVSFTWTGGTDLEVTAVIDPTVAPPGYYMLFAVDALGKPCEEAAWVRLSHRRCRLITDRSRFGLEELQAIPGRAIERALYVHVEGFLPSELGITTPTPTAAQLDLWAPSVTFSADGATVTELRATPAELILEDPALPPSARQRITFAYTLHVDDLGVFPAEGGPEVRRIDLTTDHSGWACSGRIELTRQPNPYVLDGPTHWLSTDVRVLKVRLGEERFGHTLDDPHTWLQDVLSDFDGDPSLEGHAFTGISEDQQESRLQLATTEGGVPVFNFAICRVRYRATMTQAPDVRMHFRMFTTSATNLSYQPSTTYRIVDSGGSRIALPGIDGSEVVTLPFFGTQRVDLSSAAFADQTDPLNLKTLPVDGGGAETRRYFGALLDINVPTARLPGTLPATATGPFAAGDLQPIAELVRGRHQCLVAEVDFVSDPVGVGDTPANSDNLAQRNLAIEGSDNPGGPAAHTVALSFDIDPTWGLREARKEGNLPGLNETRAPDPELARTHLEIHGEAETAKKTKKKRQTKKEREAAKLVDPMEHAAQPLFREAHWPLGDRAGKVDGLLALDPVGARFTPAHHEHASPPEFDWLTPDELMIEWGELPAGTEATLYIPSLPSEHVVRMLELRPGAPLPRMVDAHTLAPRPSGVSWLPLPLPSRRRTAGLLSVTLPPSVRVGRTYTVVVRQISLARQVVVGTFELSIPVRTGPELLLEEQRWYAVLQHIVGTLTASSRWRPVLERLLQIVAGRVEGFGGDPTQIRPTLDPADLGRRDDPCPPEGGDDKTHGDPARPGHRPPRDELCDEERILCELLLKKYCADRER